MVHTDKHVCNRHAEELNNLLQNQENLGYYDPSHEGIQAISYRFSLLIEDCLFDGRPFRDNICHLNCQ